MTARGWWNPATTYEVDDEVLGGDGAWYVALLETVGEDPTETPASWAWEAGGGIGEDLRAEVLRATSEEEALALSASNLEERLPAYQDLVYDASVAVAVDDNSTSLCKLVVTDGSAFALENPDSTAAGRQLVIDFVNASGGVMGAVTFGDKYQLAGGAFSAPANGKRRPYTFYCDGTSWVETGRAAADV